MRIASSEGFQRSRRLRDFLLYICSRKLMEREDEITEQQIGVHVFERAATYSPGEDNIVRTTARTLRQKLDLYYFEQGQVEPWRLRIPKGSYIPVFEIFQTAQLPSADLTTVPVVAEAEPQQAIPPARRWRSKAAIAAAVVLIVGIVSCLLFTPPSSGRRLARFYAVLFPRGGSCLAIPGDSGLVMTENLLQVPIHVDAYASGAYRTDTLPTGEQNEILRRFGQRRYTSIADLQLVANLAGEAEAHDSHLLVKYARDISIADLKAQNLILIGDPEGNPWVELFAPKLNFRFGMDEAHLSHVIQNTYPRGNEPRLYVAASGDPEHRAYALVALTMSLDGRGRALLIEGTTMAGLDAARDFLASSDGLAALLPRFIRASGAVENFEVLLETRSLAARGMEVRVIASRAE